MFFSLPLFFIFLKRIFLKFSTISVTSSRTPFIVENSCPTPSIFIEVTANPSKDDKRTLLSEFPMVQPKPGAKGLIWKRPDSWFEFKTKGLSGLMKFCKSIYLFIFIWKKVQQLIVL